MLGSHCSSFLWTVLAVQVIGWVSLGMVRAARDWSYRAECQLGFLIALGLVGYVTVLCLQFGCAAWIVGCLTLAAMIVGVTIDFGGRPISSSVD